jgi:hypothetical protein
VIDYHAYIPFLNRNDLLSKAIYSVPELWENLTVVDSSSKGIIYDTPLSVTLYTPPVMLSFTQCQNFFFVDAKRRGCKFMMWLHNDCVLPRGAVAQMVDRVRNYYVEGRKWGVAFSYYDIFSAVNLEMVDEVGGYDTNIRAYKSDQDFYHRVRLAGWETINTEIEVEAIKAGHVGSQTIRSDEKIALLNGVVETADNFYYQEKWGGEAGHETFDVPFGREDLFGRK